MKDLYIIGAGGFGREVAWLIERINQASPTWNIKGFIDDSENLKDSFINDYKVVGNISYLNSLGKDSYCVCAIGNTTARKTIVEKLNNISFATLIDPSVIMSSMVNVGEGTIICAGSIITTNIDIGKHVIVNLDCTIGHDDSIKDYVTIYPSVNVSGNVTIESNVEIGTGTQIIQGKTITNNVIIGAGAVVVRNIEEPGTYVGIPTKLVKGK